MPEPEQGQEAPTEGKPVRGGLAGRGSLHVGPQLSKGRRGEEASAQWGGGGRDGSPVSQMATNQVTWEPDRIMGKGGHKYRKAGMEQKG